MVRRHNCSIQHKRLATIVSSCSNDTPFHDHVKAYTIVISATLTPFRTLCLNNLSQNADQLRLDVELPCSTIGGTLRVIRELYCITRVASRASIARHAVPCCKVGHLYSRGSSGSRGLLARVVGVLYAATPHYLQDTSVTSLRQIFLATLWGWVRVSHLTGCIGTMVLRKSVGVC